VACWTGYRTGGLLHTRVPLARPEGLLQQRTVDPIIIIYESAESVHRSRCWGCMPCRQPLGMGQLCENRMGRHA
jgi:hypothetical protein